MKLKIKQIIAYSMKPFRYLCDLDLQDGNKHYIICILWFCFIYYENQEWIIPSRKTEFGFSYGRIAYINLIKAHRIENK